MVAVAPEKSWLLLLYNSHHPKERKGKRDLDVDVDVIVVKESRFHSTMLRASVEEAVICWCNSGNARVFPDQMLHKPGSRHTLLQWGHLQQLYNHTQRKQWHGQGQQGGREITGRQL